MSTIGALSNGVSRYARFLIYCVNMKKNTIHLPKVSFIIPTLNAEIHIEKCLKAIRNQRYPKNLIEIIVSDGGSTDNTLTLAKKYKAKIIYNPEKLHEPGKSLATKYAKGELLFFTDSDNILANNQWINAMVQPYIDNPNVTGFLPQTMPAPDSNLLDRYLGYLFTDPLTWFIYGPEGNPKYYYKTYHALNITTTYQLYIFPTTRYPLFGFSQGVGIKSTFRRDGIAYSDDMLGGIKLINQGHIIAYVPNAGVYHYHVTGLRNFIRKYRWRVRNNLSNKIKGMGLSQRTSYLDNNKKLRLLLFLPYALSIVFPTIDGLLLSIKERTIILLLHPIVTLVMASIIIFEFIQCKVLKKTTLGEYK